MRLETGATYSSPNWGRWLLAADAKQGKTSWMIASALGVFPGQAQGGIVDKPENLHVIAFDESALRGVKGFLLKTCGAPKEALNFRVYNLEAEFKRSTMTPGEYDRDFYSTVVQLTDRIRQACKGGVPCVIVSSLTSLAEGICRSTLGPAGDKKGAGGDRSKWPDFALQMTEIRNYMHAPAAHIIWEGHIYRVPSQSKDEVPDETLAIPGKTGIHYPANIGFICRVKRQHGKKVGGTQADLMYLDTRSPFSFASGGRGFTERLGAQETDLTAAFKKLDLEVGNWGVKSRPVTQQPQQHPQRSNTDARTR